MTRNGKRVTIATVIELVARTTAKVSVPGTSRGIKPLGEEAYREATMSVKTEMDLRGMLDV